MGDIRCPDCGRKVSITTSTGSRVTRCPKCGFAIKAPGDSGTAAKEDAARDIRLSPLPTPPSSDSSNKAGEKPAAPAPAPEKKVERPVVAQAPPKKDSKDIPPEPVRAQMPEQPAPQPRAVERPAAAPSGSGLDRLSRLPVDTVGQEKFSGEKERALVDAPPAKEPEVEKPTPSLRLSTAGESLDRLERFTTEALASEPRPARVEPRIDTSLASEPGISSVAEPTPAATDIPSIQTEEPAADVPRDMDAFARAVLAEQKQEQSAAKSSAGEGDNLSRAVAQINSLFGPDFARQHPELVTAALQAQTAEAGSADLIKRLEALESRLLRIEERLGGKI